MTPFHSALDNFSPWQKQVVSSLFASRNVQLLTWFTKKDKSRLSCIVHSRWWIKPAECLVGLLTVHPANHGASWCQPASVPGHTGNTEKRSASFGLPWQASQLQEGVTLQVCPNLQFSPLPWSLRAWAFMVIWHWAHHPFIGIKHPRPFLWDYHCPVDLPKKRNNSFLLVST